MQLSISEADQGIDQVDTRFANEIRKGGGGYGLTWEEIQLH